VVGISAHRRVIRLCTILILAITLFPAPIPCQPVVEVSRSTTKWVLVETPEREIAKFMPHYGGKLDPPIIGGLQMPKELWWFTLVACEVTGACPEDVASVMRHESDFRCGPIGYGTYVGPMGIKRRDFEKKYPIHDVFGNILTGARRLAMFKSLASALPKYNTDRSPKFARYCRGVLAGAKEAKKYVTERDHGDTAWRDAVVCAKHLLANLEERAAAYEAARRRN